MTPVDKFYMNMPREYKKFVSGLFPEMEGSEITTLSQRLSKSRGNNQLPSLKYLIKFEKFYDEKTFFEIMKYSYENKKYENDEEENIWDEYLNSCDKTLRDEYRKQSRLKYRMKALQNEGFKL